MKLATLKNNTRDGQLVIVSRDLARYVEANGYLTMQSALDDWAQAKPKLEEIYHNLNRDPSLGKPFDPKCAHAPLPRAYQWVDGSAYVTHVELVRRSRGAVMPESFWTDPLMYQGASDSFVGAHDPIVLEKEEWGIDYEGEVAIITDDVPMGINADQAAKHIQLIMLVNDVSLRGLAPGELAKGFGFLHTKPATAFSPVVVTPDELGDVWQDSKVHLPLLSYINDEQYGCPNAGIDMTFNFAKLIEHAAKTRFLGAGTIVGSGTISNAEGNVGSSCLVERRTLEQLNQGEVKTSFMKFGDRIRIEMLDKQGISIFGSIDQTVVSYKTQDCT
jgi:fumarylacetoacetate (FAA) hydrolase